MKKPKISVIMSTYNDEKFLDEAIGSILNQSFNDFEFIIINDFSKDSSLNIIKRNMRKNKRIILINNSKNLGPAISRNKGIKVAQGKYIAIMDADDISLKDRLKLQYNFLEHNNDIFLVGSSFISISESGEDLGRRSLVSKPDKIKSILPKINCIHNPTVMFRNNGKTFYREKFRYAQDYDLWLRLLSQGKKFYNFKIPLLKYRSNPNSITFSKRTKQKLFYYKAQEFYAERVRYGSDKYAQFNQNKILDLKVEDSDNLDFIREEIKSSFKINNFSKTRLLYKRYLGKNKFLDKYFIYYLLSFSNKKVINLLRRVIWR